LTLSSDREQQHARAWVHHQMRVMEKDFDNNKLMGDQLVIYGDWFSQPTRAVFIFAKMNGIPFEIKTLNFLNRD